MMSIWPRQRVTEVADGIIAVLNGEGEMGVSNSACIIDGRQAFVVDSMTFPAMAEGMVREIARRGARATMVLNTHHHIDHVGGNAAFAGAQIVAHPASVNLLRHVGLPVKMYDTLIPQFSGRFADLDLIVPDPKLDQLTVTQGGELHIFAPAHTLADVAVWLPGPRVLLAGDISFIGVTPLAVHGLLSGWIEALDAVLALGPAVVIPGHGPVGSAQDLRVQREYLSAVYQMGQRAVAEGISLTDALASLAVGPAVEWIESNRTKLNLERAMQEACGEIGKFDVSISLPSLSHRRL